MLVKFTSSLQTKNYLGLSDEHLEMLITDPYYNYLREPLGADVSAERAGTVLTLTGTTEFNVDREHVVSVQPNPELHEYGLVSYNSILTGNKVHATFKVRPYKAGVIDLDWLYEIRLIR